MRVLTFILLVAILFGCKEKSGSEKVATKTSKSTVDTSRFFQVAEYIQSQIDAVNRSPYFIYKLEMNGEKKDSSTINNAIFNEEAKHFLQPNINEPSLKKYYKESIFYDQTTNSYTLSYSTTNKDLVIQNIDVLLAEDGETVKRIFIRKFYNSNDSSTMEQLSWKPDESFQRIQLVQPANGEKETSRQTTIVWNEKG